MLLVTPGRTVAVTESAIQFPAPLMLAQATLKASAENTYDPGARTPNWRFAEVDPAVTVNNLTVADPELGVAVIRIHCAELGTVVNSKETDENWSFAELGPAPSGVPHPSANIPPPSAATRTEFATAPLRVALMRSSPFPVEFQSSGAVATMNDHVCLSLSNRMLVEGLVRAVLITSGP
jgi:hypothetical protein